MAAICEVCSRQNESIKDRFCRIHSRQKLAEMRRAGYLPSLPTPPIPFRPLPEIDSMTQN